VKRATSSCGSALNGLCDADLGRLRTGRMVAKVEDLAERALPGPYRFGSDG